MSRNTLTLDAFVDDWTEGYRREQQTLQMFNPKITAQFTYQSQCRFFSIFDELRWHFTGLLGYLAGMAPNKAYRDVLHRNWCEENGAGTRAKAWSHDELYRISAAAVGLDLFQDRSERWVKKAQRPYTKEFNERFFGWTLWQVDSYGITVGWRRIWAAYCAYELLDNIDYPAFLEMAKSFGLKGEALRFFEIHIHVQHYDQGRKLLEALWSKRRSDVEAGFAFIKCLQLSAFRGLSDDLCKS